MDEGEQVTQVPPPVPVRLTGRRHLDIGHREPGVAEGGSQHDGGQTLVARGRRRRRGVAVQVQQLVRPGTEQPHHLRGVVPQQDGGSPASSVGGGRVAAAADFARATEIEGSLAAQVWHCALD